MNRCVRCATVVALLVLPIQPLVFADVLDGLIGYWSFDEGEGKVAADVIGGHDGTVEGAAWTDNAIKGKALKFVPQDDTKVRVEDDKNLDELPDGLTVANWIRPLSRGAMMDKSGRADRIQWFLMEDGPASLGCRSKLHLYRRSRSRVWRLVPRCMVTRSG